MSPINGVNERGFFPINFNSENEGSISSTGNNLEVPNPASSDSDSNIHTTFQTILDSLIGAGTSSSEPGTGITDALSSLTGTNNNNSSLIAALEQMSKSGLPSQDSDQQNSEQTEEQILNRYQGASALERVELNSIQPLADTPIPRVISNYQQAMREFQKAFNLAPAGNPVETAQKPADTSMIADSGATSIGIGVNPAQQQVISYITEQCRQMGIPAQLGLATAETESGMLQYNKDGTPLQNSNPDSADWGLMQINDRAWGDVYDFNLIKSDWKYNVRAGLQILKESFDAALQNNEGRKGANSSLQNLVRAAYSGYNAGVGNIWRYRTPVGDAKQNGSYDVLNNEGYDLRDIRFWENYRKFS